MSKKMHIYRNRKQTSICMGLEVVVGIDSEQVQGNFGRDEMLKKNESFVICMTLYKVTKYHQIVCSFTMG